MTSYSALAGYGHLPAVISEAKEQAADGVTSRKIYNLPLGASFGNVVHELFENLPFAGFVGDNDCEADCVTQCRRFGVSADSQQLKSLLCDVVRAPIGTESGEALFSLAALDEQDVLKEMPFYFHLREGSTEQINKLLDFSRVVQPVQERKLKGYLTGFVDLVCRHRGKYYIMDYKTNYLGDYLNDYRNDLLVAAMRDHNYGLQYWIYTLVLHRFLVNTVADYDYEKDFGGVFYLFVRGMSPELPGNGLFFDRPDISVLDALHRYLGAD